MKKKILAALFALAAAGSLAIPASADDVNHCGSNCEMPESDESSVQIAIVNGNKVMQVGVEMECRTALSGLQYASAKFHFNDLFGDADKVDLVSLRLWREISPGNFTIEKSASPGVLNITNPKTGPDRWQDTSTTELGLTPNDLDLFWYHTEARFKVRWLPNQNWSQLKTYNSDEDRCGHNP
jgi:hypothetical protein